MSEKDPALTQQLQRWADGRATLKEVRGYSDDELYALARMGYVFFHQGKLEQARTVFQGLYALNPTDGYVARALAVVEMAAGNAAGALAAYEVALKVSPEDGEALVGRAEVRLTQGDRAGATDDLRRAARLVSADVALQRKIQALLGNLTRR